jgi:hypothetical protein
LSPDEQAFDYVLAHMGFIGTPKLGSFVCHQVE